MVSSFNEFQTRVAAWSDHNFGAERGLESSVWKLTGVQEELGELCHSVLKQHQGIRTDELHMEKAKDAVGDMLLYLADFCKTIGFSMHDCANLALSEVMERDWVANPKTGINTSDPQV